MISFGFLVDFGSLKKSSLSIRGNANLRKYLLVVNTLNPTTLNPQALNSKALNP